jgi:hypothetical protein
MSEVRETQSAPAIERGYRDNVVQLAEQRDAEERHATRGPLASPWLADLLNDGSERNLARRVAEFRGAVRRSLMATSKEYRVLASLELARIPGSEACQAELRKVLADNPHFVVLGKLIESEAFLGKAASEYPGPK